MAPNRSPDKILAWRPVLLFGAGLLLAGFEAVQPLFGRPVEWAIISLAATMLGLEMFSRARTPDDDSPDRGRPESRDGPGPAGDPGNQGNRGNPGALAVLVALAGPANRKAPAAAAAAAG